MFYRLKYSRYTTNVKRGWTLTELIMVIAIIAILMALLLASIVRSRAAARNLQCQNNLRQIGLAFANYESAKGILPPSNDEEGNSFYVSILPWLEAKETYELVKAKKQFTHGLPLLRCPDNSYSIDQFKAIHEKSEFVSYIACGGKDLANGTEWPAETRGIFWVPRRKLSDVTDGLSNTLSLSEGISIPIVVHGQPISDQYQKGMFLFTDKHYPFPEQEADFFADCHAMNGTSLSPYSFGLRWNWASLPDILFITTRPPQTISCFNRRGASNASLNPSSNHGDFVNNLLGDGSVKPITQSIQVDVWQALGTIAGHEVPNGR